MVNWIKKSWMKIVRTLMHRPSSLEIFAKRELDLLLDGCSDNPDAHEMQKVMNAHIMEIITTFSRQGHSGFSAGYAIGIIHKLLSWHPLTELKGTDDEWNGPDHYKNIALFQNKRCPAVFKDVYDDGRVCTRYIDYYRFSDDGGMSWFSCGAFEKKLGLSREITFPFKVPTEPKKIYIKYLGDVPDGEISDNFIDITGNEEEINNLRRKWRKDHGYEGQRPNLKGLGLRVEETLSPR